MANPSKIVEVAAWSMEPALRLGGPRNDLWVGAFKSAYHLHVLLRDLFIVDFFKHIDNVDR